MSSGIISLCVWRWNDSRVLCGLAAAPEVEANLSPAVGPPATGGVRVREREREQGSNRKRAARTAALILSTRSLIDDKFPN